MSTPDHPVTLLAPHWPIVAAWAALPTGQRPPGGRPEEMPPVEEPPDKPGRSPVEEPGNPTETPPRPEIPPVEEPPNEPPEPPVIEPPPGDTRLPP